VPKKEERKTNDTSTAKKKKGHIFSRPEVGCNITNVGIIKGKGGGNMR